MIARCNDAAASLNAALDTKSRRDAFNLARRSMESRASFLWLYFLCSTAICSDNTSALFAIDRLGPCNCSERNGESSSTCVSRQYQFLQGNAHRRETTRVEDNAAPRFSATPLV